MHQTDFLETKEELKPAFINPTTNERTKIECIRVDGGNDEGPGHLEVQFFWTKRHLERGTIVQLSHANLYIPSTFNGSCMENGKVNHKKLSENLNDAIDVYISRVNGCPCGDIQIHFFKDPESKESQKLRDFFKIYVKGTTKKRLT